MFDDCVGVDDQLHAVVKVKCMDQESEFWKYDDKVYDLFGKMAGC